MSDAGARPMQLDAALSAMPADSLSAVRSAAAARFAACGFPTTRHEDWKYTNLASAEALSRNWLEAAGNEEAAAGAPVSAAIMQQVDAYWLVIRNGRVDGDFLTNCARLAGEGIEISTLSDAAAGPSIDIDDPLAAFNAALLQDGLYIRAKSGASLGKPLGILHLDDATATVSQVRVLIELSANARLQVLESSRSDGDGEQFQNAVTQAALADGATLEFVRIQERAPAHQNVNRVTARLAADALFDYSSFDFGGALARNDVVADIGGPGASVVLRGLYLGADRQHIDNHTRVDHRVGPAKSVEEYRGILGGRSRCVFNGKAVVHAGADGTDADQSNHNLLLSDTAEIDTKPELEIYADDVKCSHGATVGQLDRTALFYLRSRGLDEDAASQILTRAFAATISSGVPIAACADYIAAAIDAKLDALISEVNR